MACWIFLSTTAAALYMQVALRVRMAVPHERDKRKCGFGEGSNISFIYSTPHLQLGHVARGTTIEDNTFNPVLPSSSNTYPKT